MNLITVLAIGVGLAMDCFAISIASGATYKQLNIKHTIRIALFFGGFQAVMPILGSLAGLGLKETIAGFDHWVAFAILLILGLKMCYESLKIKEVQENYRDPTELIVLLGLSVATSIDALAVGVTISILAMSVIKAAAIIGIVTFVFSCFGVYIGKKFGYFLGNKIEIIGGIILVLIGFKILFEHIWQKPI